MWDELYAAGKDYGIQPFGEAATNMARLEAGFIMPAMEFNEALRTVNFEHDQTPFELNLGWLVDFKKPHFNGRNALLSSARNSAARSTRSPSSISRATDRQRARGSTATSAARSISAT
jgi:glycine cleavage system aminomethyltransferase T